MPGPTPARDRLLDTAGALFYDRGITATGVDAVVAAAGVSKPTLYAHFRSKSELVAAVLDRRHTRRTTSLREWVAARAGGPRERLLAAESPDPGDPVRQVARRQERWIRDFLAELAREAAADEPERLGSQLLLLMDGVSGRLVVEGSQAAREIAGQARAAAAILLDAATGSGTGRSR